MFFMLHTVVLQHLDTIQGDHDFMDGSNRQWWDLEDPFWERSDQLLLTMELAPNSLVTGQMLDSWHHKEE